MKSCTVVTVCGSGVVTSSMIALKIKEQLRDKGWDATMLEASPVSLNSVITGKDVDVIVCASPVTEDVGIPKTLDKIKEEDLDVLATDALNDACYPGNPREATKEQVIEMFKMLMA